MFNSTYGAGYRAGMARPKFKHNADGTKTVVEPACPLSPWRIVSYTLWNLGYHDGLVKRSS